ncbi:ParA family protein [Fervidibacter sacchari]
MVVIAFASLKGGTGKTTLTYNLASFWADSGRKVLAVDFDPQGNLTFAFLPPESLPEEAYTRWLFSRKSPQPFQVSENLWLLGSDNKLSSWDMRGTSPDLFLPSQLIRSLPFELVLLDTPTGWRPLTRAAIFSCDYLVVPVDPSPFAVAGIVQLVEGLVELSERQGKAAEILGVVVNLAEEHTRITQKVIASVKQLMSEERFLGVLSKSVRVKETVLERKPLHVLAPQSKLSQQIEEIAKAIERRVMRR